MTLLILSLLRKRKSSTWFWWRSSVFLGSNLWRRNQKKFIMVTRIPSPHHWPGLLRGLHAQTDLLHFVFNTNICISADFN